MALISLVIYILLGTPGLSLRSTNPQSAGTDDVPQAQAKIESLVYPSKDLICPPHDYNVHIFSTHPLVMYIDNFISETEIEHLLALSAPNWQLSTIFNAGAETHDASVRNSEKALLTRSTTVQCLERRALALQGWPTHTFIERLWTQRYNVSGHYALHYDWASASKLARRVSSFMVYLQAPVRGGGTRFPRLERPKGGGWCEFVECGDGEEDGKGVTFRARRGAAVFWRNFDEEGRGFKETVHAGLPVLEGQKVGLNVWSWYQRGHEAP